MDKGWDFSKVSQWVVNGVEEFRTLARGWLK